jgi:hypothetical protein
MNAAKYREILDENLLQSTQDLWLTRRFTFQQDNDPKQTAKTTRERLRDKSPARAQTWTRSNVSGDLKIDVRRSSPSNLTGLERICRKEWEKLPKYRSAKLVASYPRSWGCNHCQMCFKGSEYLCKCVMGFLFRLIRKKITHFRIRLTYQNVESQGAWILNECSCLQWAKILRTTSNQYWDRIEGSGDSNMELTATNHITIRLWWYQYRNVFFHGKNYNTGAGPLKTSCNTCAVAWKNKYMWIWMRT